MLSQLLLVVAVTLGAATDDTSSPAARLKSIESEVASAGAKFEEARAKLADPLQDDPVVDDLHRRANDKRRAGFAAALEIARADPQSDVGFEALQWLLLNAPPDKSVLELITRYHAGNPKIGKSGAIAHVALHPPYGLPGAQEKSLAPYDSAYQPAIDLLNAVANNNPDRCARGQAAIGLALQVKRAYDFAEVRSRPEAQRLRSQAEQAFEAVVKDYGDCPAIGIGRNGWDTSNLPVKGAATLGEVARAKLTQLRGFGNLMIGKTAPDIAGEDVNGAGLKLSDYRGKVVLLVFWASWCGPCMSEVPHELELVDRFKGKPFVLIGINADAERARAQRSAAMRHIVWRSFWDGPNGPYGPILTSWNIQGLPTVYVIDKDGVIRYSYLYGNQIDAALAKLISEAAPAETGGH